MVRQADPSLCEGAIIRTVPVHCALRGALLKVGQGPTKRVNACIDALYPRKSLIFEGDSPAGNGRCPIPSNREVASLRRFHRLPTMTAHMR